jgi:WD40 repeat protein
MNSYNLRSVNFLLSFALIGTSFCGHQTVVGAQKHHSLVTAVKQHPIISSIVAGGCIAGIIYAAIKYHQKGILRQRREAWEASNKTWHNLGLEQQKIALELDETTKLPREITTLIAEYVPDFRGRCVASIDRAYKAPKVLTALPDGTFAVPALDGTIHIWNPATKTELFAITEGDGSVDDRNETRALVVLPNNKLLSAGGSAGHLNGRFKIWDLTTHNCLHTYQLNVGGENSTFAILSNGLVAWSGGDSNPNIEIWDMNTGTLLRTLNGESTGVEAIIAFPNNQLASGNKAGTIKIWDSTTGNCIRTMNGHQESVTALALVSSNILASGAADGTIKIWDLLTGNCLHTIQGVRSITSMVVLPNGILATGNAEGAIKTYDPPTGTCLHTLSKGVGSPSRLTVLPNGMLVAVISSGGEIKIWE